MVAAGSGDYPLVVIPEQISLNDGETSLDDHSLIFLSLLRKKSLPLGATGVTAYLADSSPWKSSLVTYLLCSWYSSSASYLLGGWYQAK